MLFRSEGKEETATLNVLIDKIQTKEGEEPEHSHNYTSHCWTNEGLLVVGTDQGELLTLDSSGCFLGMNQLENCINCISAYPHGIAVACEGPLIMTMMFNNDKLTMPFKEENT